MPTENRSSNTEMVSVPEGFMLVERSIWTEQQVEAATACITRLKGVPGMRDCDLAMAAIDAAQCRAPDIALSDLLPAPQPHPDPIAWMVGTAFWWTKEEAERDSADTGLPIVGLGPMAGVAPAEQHQGEPVALPARMSDLDRFNNPLKDRWNACLDEITKLGPLYTLADPAEVERLREQVETLRLMTNDYLLETERLRTQLAELQQAFTESQEEVVKRGKILAEAQALLHEAANIAMFTLPSGWHKRRAALSANPATEVKS
ncbi:hypothetical protein [Pseudomonas sp.]|uniref:hypothetical protein n=1 Tax=Pseudomonas sp. TaxID=306 RepID=UPI0028AC95AE|nr:hypothetical protein [Pseudomonas sp.]